MSRCASTRRRISDRTEHPATDQHLEGCADCRAWAEALRAVRRDAPTVVPQPPDGLTDRVLAGVRSVAPAAPARPAAPWWRRPATIAAAAAVVLVATVASALTLSTGSDDPRQVLAASVRTVASPDGGGVRFEVDGRLVATLPTEDPPDDLPTVLPSDLAELPDVLSDLPDLPESEPEIDDEESRRQFERYRAQVRQQLEQQLDEAREEVDRRSSELRMRLRDELDRITDHPLPAWPGRFEVRFDGTGKADSAGRSTATIDYRITAPVEHAGRLELITVPEATYLRTSRTGTWVRLAGRYEGFRFGGLTAPDDLRRVLDRLDNPAGPVEELGERTVDGVTVRGLRVGQGPTRIGAWIGVDDGRLYELHHRTDLQREGGRLSATTTFRFRDHGTDVTVSPPSDWIPLSELPPDRRPPFSFSARIDLDTDR